MNGHKRVSGSRPHMCVLLECVTFAPLQPVNDLLQRVKVNQSCPSCRAFLFFLIRRSKFGDFFFFFLNDVCYSVLHLEKNEGEYLLKELPLTFLFTKSRWRCLQMCHAHDRVTET